MLEEVQVGNTTIEMESKIIQVVRQDNTRGNTIHFKWDRTPFTPTKYILDVITHNIRNGQNFLLKRIEGEGQSDCLSRMLEYVQETHKTEHNWTVFWTDEKGDAHQSYFRGVDEDEVRSKFFYEENTKATIDTIKKSSIA